MLDNNLFSYFGIWASPIPHGRDVSRSWRKLHWCWWTLFCFTRSAGHSQRGIFLCCPSISCLTFLMEIKLCFLNNLIIVKTWDLKCHAAPIIMHPCACTCDIRHAIHPLRFYIFGNHVTYALYPLYYHKIFIYHISFIIYYIVWLFETTQCYNYLQRISFFCKQRSNWMFGHYRRLASLLGKKSTSKDVALFKPK